MMPKSLTSSSFTRMEASLAPVNVHLIRDSITGLLHRPWKPCSEFNWTKQARQSETKVILAGKINWQARHNGLHISLTMASPLLPTINFIVSIKRDFESILLSASELVQTKKVPSNPHQKGIKILSTF